MGLGVVGLFAGIGGIELGLEQAGHRSTFLCEIEPAAQHVLRSRFVNVPLVGDVRSIKALPPADIVAGGFPCQDLSQAGRTAGISGSKSGIVAEVFKLMRPHKATWLLLENVPFMLQLERGTAMRYLTSSLEDLGFRWAYRTVDTRAFGLPQRRRRVVLLASRSEDPRAVLFPGNIQEPEPVDHTAVACGFYWTEGLRGLGWAVDAVPTLKGGSTIGIPSPPGIRFTDGSIGTPELRDAERLQGFPSDWTSPADALGQRGARWKLVGNAVSVPVAKWLGERLASPVSGDDWTGSVPIPAVGSWPAAGWGEPGTTPSAADVSAWPTRAPYAHLEQFLQYESIPLSLRAAQGFLRRAYQSSLRFPPGFIDSVAAHVESMTGARLVA
jgi:DNA (cytosine-5)-methyltransferase 1